MISVTLPIRLVSEANARDGWRKKARRVAGQRNLVAMALRTKKRFSWTALNVTITRVAPIKLDDDNNVSSAKAVRDGVADYLGTDDSDHRILWHYAQERGTKPREYAVRIELEAAP